MTDRALPKPAYYLSPPLALSKDPKALRYSQAVLEFHGVEHRTWSYNVSIFINNKSATAKTPHTLEEGFVGSFLVFAHGGCYGDEGHCEVPVQRRPYDWRRPHALLPLTKSIDITEGLRYLLPKGGSFTVKVVGEAAGGAEKCEPDDEFMKFSYLRLVTHQY